MEGVWNFQLEEPLTTLLIFSLVGPRKNVISLPEGRGSGKEQGQAWYPHHRLPFSSSDKPCPLGSQGLCTAILCASNVPPLSQHHLTNSYSIAIQYLISAEDCHSKYHILKEQAHLLRWPNEMTGYISLGLLYPLD